MFVVVADALAVHARKYQNEAPRADYLSEVVVDDEFDAFAVVEETVVVAVTSEDPVVDS